jgi:hypothetical protein
LAETSGDPFYEKLNRALESAKFDPFCEQQCKRFYAENKGRPSLVPGVYFRLMLLGSFEGIDSKRGISWRVADSLSLRQFIGYGIDETTPDYGVRTMAGNRQRRTWRKGGRSRRTSGIGVDECCESRWFKAGVRHDTVDV